MQWADAVRHHLDSVKPLLFSRNELIRLYSLIDFTSLNATDTTDSLSQWCEQAVTNDGHVAAVCVYPAFVRLMALRFANQPVKVATVVNFPYGHAALPVVLHEIQCALDDGADEIDMVLPYQQYLSGQRMAVQDFIAACKFACGKNRLKVILETGALQDPAIVAAASIDALRAGADFIKTSTGKHKQGATLEAVAIMLLAIQKISPTLQHRVGIKVSGGVRDLSQAAAYFSLTTQVMGEQWISPYTFRIGASQLVAALLSAL